MSTNCISVLLLLVLLLPDSASAQDDALPRRGFFGVNLQPSSDGPRVAAVVEGSTASAFGVRAGDVIKSVAGRPVSTPEAVVAAVGAHKAGARITLELLRGAERVDLDVTLKPLPEEKMTSSAVRYGSVRTTSGQRLRTILSVPNQGGPRFPAALLLQGGSCGSIDAPLAPLVAQPGLMHAIAAEGFVTLRVEKPGVGDSEGPPCETIGYHQELAGYVAALQALQAEPSVDPSRIYLIGVSLGGVFAPIVAAGQRVAGISIYGSLDHTPSEYPGRSARFFQEFAGVDVEGAWRKVTTRVQTLHGEYDEGTARSAHEHIAAIVNQSRPGAAEFHELPGLDHCWSRHASLEASRNKCGQGEQTTAYLDAILGFLKGK